MKDQDHFRRSCECRKLCVLGLHTRTTTRLDINEFTKTNFVFLLISLERILDQKTLE